MLNMSNNNYTVFKNTTEIDGINKSTTSKIGICLFIFCVLSLTYYIYVIKIIVANKLWKQHSFYLWFISISMADIAILIVYVYDSFTVICTYDPLTKSFAIILGWLYICFDNVARLHLFTTAAVRTIAIILPIKALSWLNVRNTVISIAVSWLVLGVVNTAGILYFKGYWLWFNPERMTLDMNDYGLMIAQGVTYYWLATTIIIDSSAIALYMICIYKLRKSNMATQQNNTTGNGHSQKAEKNIITICLVIVLISLFDWFLWYNSIVVLRIGAWWMELLLTVIEIIMYAVNALLISMLSREIYEKTFIARILKKLGKILMNKKSSFCSTTVEAVVTKQTA